MSFCKSIAKENLQAEFIIVDNGSTDNTPGIIEDEIFKLIPANCKGRLVRLARNYGTTRPRNIALRECKGNYIVVCDSDTSFLDGCWSDTIKYMENKSDHGIIAPLLINEGGKVQQSVKLFPTMSDKILKLGKIFFKLKTDKSDYYKNFPFNYPREVDTAISAFWMFRRELLDTVGYLDERIFYSPEDIDYCLRVWKSGKTVCFYPSLRIFHRDQRISHKSPLSFVALTHLCGLLYYYRKHKYLFSRRNLYKKLYRPDQLKIVFVTQEDPFYVKQFFSEFFKNYPSNIIKVKGLIIQETFNCDKKTTIKRSLYLFGYPGFMYMAIKFILLKVISYIEALARIPLNCTIKSIAIRNSVPILKFKSINDSAFCNYINEHRIDLIVSIAASEVFKKKVLASPRYGCINLHSGPLPFYRGMMPNFWVLFNKEQYASITVHQMVERLDRGDILLQHKFNIMPGESYNSLAQRSKRIGAALVLRVLESIHFQAPIKKLPLDSPGSYYTFPTKDEVYRFKQAGGRVL